MRKLQRLLLAMLVLTASLTIAPISAGAQVGNQLPDVLFVSHRDGNAEIYRMKSDGSAQQRLTSHPAGDFHPDISRDGSKIVFVSLRNGRELWTMNADGTNQQRLTTNALNETHPRWSPDGSKIVFQAEGALRMVTADGSDTGFVVPNGLQPSWSPDGSKIAFQGNDGYLQVVNPDGTGRARLIERPYSYDPEWVEPNRIIFGTRIGGPSGPHELASIRPDGTGFVQLTFDPSATEQSADLSPDGSEIIFWDITPPSSIGLVPVSGGAATYYSLTGVSTDPRFFPATPDQNTGTGQDLQLSITAPSDGSSITLPQPALSVSGNASVTPLAGSTDPLSVQYVVDLSGSTSEQTNMNCDGLTGVTATDDLNGDGSRGDILDCEIAGVTALNKSLESRPDTNVGLVGLTSSPGLQADMSPATGAQAFVAPGADLSSLPGTDVETVVKSLRRGHIGQFTPLTAGTGTVYRDALEKARLAFLTRPSAELKTIYFLSDGEPTDGSQYLTPLASLKAMGVKIHTFSVGTNGPGCLSISLLKKMARETGGLCNQVTDPTLVSNALTQPIAIQKVQVSLNGGPKQLANFDPATGQWNATIANPIPGTNSIVATATATDGTTKQETVSITAIAPPNVDAGGPYSVPEGSSVQLNATADDPENGALTYSWSGSSNLSATDIIGPDYQGVDDGTETLTFTATDPDNLSSSDTTDVTTVNVAPSVGPIAIPGGVNEGQSFDASALFTDPGTLDTHTVEWDWGDGTVELGTVESSGSQFKAMGSHTYATGGQYTIKLTVTDDDGGQAQTSTGPFNVNRTPLADAGGPYTVDEGSSVQLNGTASDPDGDALSFNWTPAGGLDDPNAENPTFTGKDDEIRTLTFTATDGGGLFHSSDTTVQVLNVAPSLKNVNAPAEVRTGTPFEITGGFDDPGTEDTHTIDIDWGDGDTTSSAVGAPFAKSHTYAASGTYLVTLTVTDDDGGSDTKTLQAVVVNSPPVVDAGGPYTLTEGSSLQLDGMATDPDGDSLTLEWTPSQHFLNDSVEDPFFMGVDDDVITVELKATDPYGATATDTAQVTIVNAAPVLGSIIGPDHPVAKGTQIELKSSFTDAGPKDTHTATVNWGDGTTTPADIIGPDIVAKHTYTNTGIYTVNMTITDDDGGSDTRIFQYAVVYDPNGGFVTGGGHFNSPAGAYAADPTLTGKANFGFNAKYKKGAHVPDGNTEFQFKAADLNFKSTAYEWLVIAGKKAQYKGVGTINGKGEYAFMLTAIDGNMQGGDKVDRIRIRIWDKTSGGLIYDNEVGKDENGDPSTALGGGSIVIHKG